ncbi:acyl-CoA thioesterase [Gordonia phosphorivorans]|uniref:Acyl-CoA thioesterase n=1 Tax=Gordonia phosphorivorans TaxID=1056982 RepID=A0ABV6HC29_9ACTN
MSAFTGALAALDLTPVDDDRFTAPNIDLGARRLFGGQLLAQMLIAAARTVPAPAAPHSLHAYFLAPGDSDAPVEYAVTRTRDGRRMSNRSVNALQGDRVLATALVAASVPGDGCAHQAPMPVVAPPEECPTLAAWAEPWGGLTEIWSTMDIAELRVVPDPPDGTTMVWLRAAGDAGDRPEVHAALILLMADITALAAGLAAHDVPIGGEHLGDRPWGAVSLDHAMWFHRAARADEWLLYAQRSPTSAAGRGLVVGDVFTRDGRCVGSFTQEGLFAQA